MNNYKLFFTTISIGLLLFGLSCSGLKVSADTSPEDNIAVFINEQGEIIDYVSYDNSSELTPPEEAVSFEWSEEDYKGKSGCFTVFPSVPEPDENKVYTGVFVNNVFVPVFETDIEMFTGRDDGSNYYYYGFPESAFDLSWNGLTVGHSDASAEWKLGVDPISINEVPQIAYNDVREQYKDGYYSPSKGGFTYLAPTSESCFFYTVTFIWPEGIETQVIRAGEQAIPPVLSGAYKEWEWSTSAYQNVQGELFVRLYNPNESKINVFWQDYDGTVLVQMDVPAAAPPAYPNTTPLREPDEDYVYKFSGWEMTDSSETGRIYKAVYSKEPRWTVVIRYQAAGRQLGIQKGRFVNHEEYSFVPLYINGYKINDSLTGIIDGADIYRNVSCQENRFYGKQGYILDGKFMELSDVIVSFNTGTYCVYNVGRNGVTPLKVPYNDGRGERYLDLYYPVYGSTSGSYAECWRYGTSPDDISTPFLKAMGDRDEYLYGTYVGLRPSTTISDLEPLYVAYHLELFSVTFVYPDVMDKEPVVLSVPRGWRVTPPDLSNLYEWDAEAYEPVGETLEIHAVQICTGHEVVIDEAVAPTCEESGLTEGSHCNKCGRILVPQEEIYPLEHVFAEDEGVPATCLETGLSLGYHCSVCGKVLEEQTETPPLGHSWLPATYVWADDNSYATATHVCRRDASHIETETAAATAEVIQLPTWNQEGITEYTAVFENPAFKMQKTTAADVPTIPLHGTPWGTCSWVLYDGILTVSAGKGTDTGGISPWKEYEKYINSIIFEPGVELPEDASGLFKGLGRVKEISLNGSESEHTINCSSMFYGCVSLETLNLETFDSGSCESMDKMFYSCFKLTNVLLGKDFSFWGNSDHVLTTLPENLIWKDPGGQKMAAITMAKRNNPGTYTGIDTGLKWGTCPVDFIDGVMTFYAGNGTEFFLSSGKGSTVRHMVFTEGVHFPEYPGYIVADRMYLESVTLEEGVDTSDVKSFSFSFAYAGPSLKKIDLSGATSESLLDTSDMFHEYLNNNIEEIILGSGFTCEHVTNMEYMFITMPKLKKLDLTYFDPSSAIKVSNLIKRCDSLEEIDLSGKDFSRAEGNIKWFNLLPGLKRLNLSDTKLPPEIDWNGLKEDERLEVIITGNNEELPLSFYESLPVNVINGSGEWFSLDSQTYERGEDLRNAVMNGTNGVLVKCSMEISDTETVYDAREHSIKAFLSAPDGFYPEFRRDSSESWSTMPPSYINACATGKPYQVQVRIRSDSSVPADSFFIAEQLIHPRDISNPEVIVTGGNEYISLGCRIEPVWTIGYGDNLLEENTEYRIISRGKNSDPGQGYVKVKGINNFTGERLLQFTIISWDELNILRTPEALQEIEPEAFKNTSGQIVIVSSGCSKIGSLAFADCKNLMGVVIPESVHEIAEDAFEGTDIFIYVPEGSYAEEYAKTMKIQYVLYDDGA